MHAVLGLVFAGAYDRRLDRAPTLRPAIGLERRSHLTEGWTASLRPVDRPTHSSSPRASTPERASRALSGRCKAVDPTAGSVPGKRAARKANVRDSVHVLRHTFCSHLAMRGAPARAIQELAGHSDLGVTQRYMHLSPRRSTRRFSCSIAVATAWQHCGDGESPRKV